MRNRTTAIIFSQKSSEFQYNELMEALKEDLQELMKEREEGKDKGHEDN